MAVVEWNISFEMPKEADSPLELVSDESRQDIESHTEIKWVYSVDIAA